MKKLLLLIPFLLVGCKSVPVQQEWPGVPDELLQACPDLQQVEQGTTKLSEILQVVTDNYSTYYECKSKVDDWIVWYKGQKKIYEGK